MVGPIARLELVPAEGDTSQLLEAHLGAEEYRALQLKEGDTVLVSPRKARVFLETTDDPAVMI